MTDPDTPVAGKQIQNDDNADNDAHVDFEAEDDDGDYTPAPGVKNSLSDEYVTLNIPRDAMSQLSPLAYRLKLSTRQQTTSMAGVFKVGGVNVNDTTLSVSTTHRQRHAWWYTGTERRSHTRKRKRKMSASAFWGASQVSKRMELRSQISSLVHL